MKKQTRIMEYKKYLPWDIKVYFAILVFSTTFAGYSIGIASEINLSIIIVSIIYLIAGFISGSRILNQCYKMKQK